MNHIYNPAKTYYYRITAREWINAQGWTAGADIIDMERADINDQASMDDAFLRIYEDPVGVLLDCMRISKSFSWGCGGWMLEFADCKNDCLHHVDISEREARAALKKRNTEK